MTLRNTRRSWLTQMAAGLGISSVFTPRAVMANQRGGDLTIKDLRITPIALPDPPLLAAGGCHGPYFLRNIIELETTAGVTGIGETHGGEGVTLLELEQCRQHCVGKSAFAYRSFAPALKKLGNSTYSGIELACLGRHWSSHRPTAVCETAGRSRARRCRVCLVLVLPLCRRSSRGAE